MGSVYAGLLAAAGLDVWAVDLWADHVDAIRRDGLKVSGAAASARFASPRPKRVLEKTAEKAIERQFADTLSAR